MARQSHLRAARFWPRGSVYYEKIGAVFENWDRSDGPLRGDYLIGIDARICWTREPGDSSKPVLSTVRDNVVQNMDNSEGTGTWAVEEGVTLHVPHSTIAASHLFRVPWADAAKRESVAKTLGGKFQPSKSNSIIDVSQFVNEDVQQGVHELNGFVAHMFDSQNRGTRETRLPEKGSHHFELKSVKGIKEDQ
ncbi:hypothetical protein N0V88_007912 [Collariella sp. IMI 366227]|nr:hypothetical protein N0V88_007912 [Collariella sp. IMI 366227]